MDSGSVDEGGSTLPMDDYDTLISTTDVELLKRAWRNEKAAPDILRFQFDLIKRVTEQIQLLVSSLLFPPFSFSLIKTLAPFSNFFILFIYFFIYFQEETVEEKSTDGTDPLSVSLYQMDLDRTLFLLRSYLRIRIQKVAIITY